jgi:hypothetical protein
MRGVAATCDSVANHHRADAICNPEFAIDHIARAEAMETAAGWIRANLDRSDNHTIHAGGK